MIVCNRCLSRRVPLQISLPSWYDANTLEFIECDSEADALYFWCGECDTDPSPVCDQCGEETEYPGHPCITTTTFPNSKGQTNETTHDPTN